MNFRVILFIAILFAACTNTRNPSSNPMKAGFTWDNATVYFLLTDRFNDGDASNNYQHSDDNPPAPFRGFMGGDIKGITQKIEDGYFPDLGVNAIWMTPLVEQIRGSVDEGTGNSFGFHGYWTRDWTALDPRFGTREELKEMVQVAHDHKIRILIDVVANHTGPVTDLDTKWPDEWVKTGPRCRYADAQSTIDCTLVENLPDIRTESTDEISLPPFLVEKWKEENRYEREVAELDEWFAETGYPRTAVHYILKWIVDFIVEFGVDGFRVDTVKHTEAYVWTDLWRVARKAYERYKEEHSDPVLDEDSEFYMVGEVYNYFVSGGRQFDYGDQKVDFFDHGFKSLINFDFKSDARSDYETIFSKYDRLLNGPLKGKSVLNYISSHDDGGPYDLNREDPTDAGTKLLLCPGGVQIYYGDETARSLTVEAQGDATLRSFMNWDELKNRPETRSILEHWQKIGKFRNDNPSIGAGRHAQISSDPYVFGRYLEQEGSSNTTVVGLGMQTELKEIPVDTFFRDGTKVRDAYSGATAVVEDKKVRISSSFDIVLLEQPSGL